MQWAVRGADLSEHIRTGKWQYVEGHLIVSRFVGRFVIICLCLAGALFLAFKLALGTEKAQLYLYKNAESARMHSASPVQSDPDMITARPCPYSGCVLIEASGRDFLVGAGEGAASSLFFMGSLNANLDGVLLTDLSRNQIEGLPGVRDRTLEAGRREPLQIYGPSGTDRVVEGVNAMLETSDADRSVRFSQGLLPFSAAPVELVQMGDFADGDIVFDSGVLSNRIYNVLSGTAGSDALIYRFDQDGATLIVGGCRARIEDIRRALDDDTSERWGLVLPLANERLLQIRRDMADEAGLGRESRFVGAAAEDCLTVASFGELIQQTGAPQALAWPLFPRERSGVDRKLWLSDVEAMSGRAAGFQLGTAAESLRIDPVAD